MQVTTQIYTKLLSEIRKTIKQTEENLVASVNYEKVKMSWQIGEKIEGFLRKNLKPSERNNYGKELVVRLSKDTNIHERVLYQMHAFYKTYKTLPSPEKKLNWSHYRNLVSVKDDTKRLLLEDLVVKEDLSSKKLQKEVVKTNKKTKNKNYVLTKLRCKRGQLFTHTLKNGKIDLGFNIYLNAKHKAPSTKNEYTYKAKLERIVDGDTIHVTLDLGFGVEHREILRLSQIDAAASDTAEGKKVTRFLQENLRGVAFLIVRTNKTDIYGRYVADVFFDKKISDPQLVANEGVYLNQLLLDRGLVKVWKS
ncbi:MAG: hypothetical protein KGP29_01530 [Proteobacteria bacterium]|nr:hypothetical protein [Pseudomonadota bacterium]